MSQDQIDGMAARAEPKEKNCELTGNRKKEWIKGWNAMDERVHEMLRYAESMLNGMLEVQRDSGRVKN